MKYYWNDDALTLKCNDKCIFLNPQKNTWIKAKYSIKKLLDSVVEGDENINVPKDKKDAILKQFIDLGFLRLEDEKLQQNICNHNYIRSIYLTITKRCNLRCAFCSLGSNPEIEETSKLTMSEIKSIVDNLSSYAIGTIIITGGEPAMRSDLLDIIDYIHSKLDCNLILETNGLLINSEFIKKVEGKLSHIDISFENIFEKDAQWQKEKILGLVNEIKIRNIPLLFSYVLTSQNWNNVFEFIDLVAKYKPKDVIIRNVTPIGNGEKNKYLLLDEKKILSIYREIYKYIFTKQYDLPCIESFVRMNLPPRSNCSGKGEMLVLSTDGNVYSCPSLYHSEFCLGNIIEDGVDTILENNKTKKNSNFYKECFDIDKRAECSQCEIKYFCGGMCFAQVYSNSELKDKLPEDCELRKILINYNIWQYNPEIGFLQNLEKIIDIFDRKILCEKS